MSVHAVDPVQINISLNACWWVQPNLKLRPDSDSNPDARLVVHFRIFHLVIAVLAWLLVLSLFQFQTRHTSPTHFHGTNIINDHVIQFQSHVQELVKKIVFTSVKVKKNERLKVKKDYNLNFDL